MHSDEARSPRWQRNGRLLARKALCAHHGLGSRGEYPEPNVVCFKPQGFLPVVLRVLDVRATGIFFSYTQDASFRDSLFDTLYATLYNMSDTISNPQKRMAEIEALMADPAFWENKDRAQAVLKELNSLKAATVEADRFEKGSAIITIFSGAGGDDAEDFSRMLLEMYMKYADRVGWTVSFIHDSQNDHGGYRNVTFEVAGKPVKDATGTVSSVGPYGTLKKESGVHRLVRISPFNSDKKRHTSFSLVEVVPKFDKVDNVPIAPEEIRIEFAKSSGPGGQNVNKRETAVRLIHIPTKLSVHVSSERSQADNRSRAMAILQAKIYKMREDERLAKEKGMQISKTTDIEWGNQIRSYVLHPYKMVKDHRTDAETANVDAVLGGDIDMFIEAERGL